MIHSSTCSFSDLDNDGAFIKSSLSYLLSSGNVGWSDVHVQLYIIKGIESRKSNTLSIHRPKHQPRKMSYLQMYETKIEIAEETIVVVTERSSPVINPIIVSSIYIMPPIIIKIGTLQKNPIIPRTEAMVVNIENSINYSPCIIMV